MSSDVYVRPKFTLGDVKIINARSRGSVCFSALVYFDGCLIGMAECEGRGDATVLRPWAVQSTRGRSKQIPIDKHAVAAAEAYVKTNPLRDSCSAGGIEDYVDEAIEIEQIKKQIMRRMKSKCLLLDAAGQLQAFTTNLQAEPAMRKQQLARFQKSAEASHPGSTILNNIDLDEAAWRVAIASR